MKNLWCILLIRQAETAKPMAHTFITWHPFCFSIVLGICLHVLPSSPFKFYSFWSRLCGTLFLLTGIGFALISLIDINDNYRTGLLIYYVTILLIILLVYYNLQPHFIHGLRLFSFCCFVVFKQLKVA